MDLEVQRMLVKKLQIILMQKPEFQLYHYMVVKKDHGKEDLKGVDLLIFDIQDVGVRFYTFISSLEEFMEAAFEYQNSIIIARQTQSKWSLC